MLKISSSEYGRNNKILGKMKIKRTLRIGKRQLIEEREETDTIDDKRDKGKRQIT